MATSVPIEADGQSTNQRILDATLAVLSRDGIAGVTMRAVAREAGVAVGLANYHFQDKPSLICAALEQIGAQDLALVEPDTNGDPAGHLRKALCRAVDPALLEADYVSLRLQLWSLAGVDERFAAINSAAQEQYLAGLADLISAARPDLSQPEVEQRAADILIIQNGVWLTAILIADAGAIERAIARCCDLAFG